MSSITLYYVLYETSETFLKEMFWYPAVILVTKQESIDAWNGTIAEQHAHAFFEAAQISIMFDQYLVFHLKLTVQKRFLWRFGSVIFFPKTYWN